VARDAIARLPHESDRKRFQVAAAAQEGAILADREEIRSALAQLLDNGLRYSEPGSTVDIFVTPEERRMGITIRSKGPTISVDDCERIFERFYRAPQTQHVTAGTGLGLSIVKKIVNANQGSVWAEPLTGYGTSFSIALPLAARGSSRP
jgi:signal transduction histidine kinase